MAEVLKYFAALLLILSVQQLNVLAQTIITGALVQDIAQSQFDGTIDVSAFSGGSVLQLQFMITNGIKKSATAFIATVHPDGLDSNYPLRQYYGENPALNNYSYDLDAMWDFRTQYMNLEKRNSRDTIFYKIVNYDPAYRRQRIQYSIELGPSGANFYNCAPCANGQSSNNNCLCISCQGGSSGTTCSRKIINTQQKNITIVMAAFESKYYRLPANNMVLNVDIDVGLVEVYVQLQTFQNQVASYYNVAIGQNTQGRFSLIAGSEGIKISVNTNEKAILITAVSLVNIEIHATVGVVQQGQVSSVLVIVMGVLGGLLLIALIAAAICIVRKSRQQTFRVSSQMNLPSQNNKLSGQQIQRYFPSCILSQILGEGDNSINKVNLNQKQQNSDNDCVICLQIIKQSDEIRMGYCRHLFHSNCLIGWLKKQRNCPYCRKQFNRNDTLADYNRILQQKSNKVLFGADLVREIYRSKPSSNVQDQKMAVINV